MQTKMPQQPEMKRPSKRYKLWQQPAVQQRFIRLRGWVVRALEKLAEDG